VYKLATTAGAVAESGAVGVAVGAGGAAELGGLVGVGVVDEILEVWHTPDEDQHVKVTALHDAAAPAKGAVVRPPNADLTNEEGGSGLLSRDHLAELVDDCIRAYEDADAVGQHEGLVRLFRYDESDGFSATLYEKDDHDVLVFRGTANLMNAATDLNAVAVSLAEVYTELDSADDLRCHRGFATLLQPHFDELADALAERNRPYRLTGHSLAAALSQLYAYLVATLRPHARQPFETIGFGGPRVFVEGAFDKYMGEVHNCYRFANDRDPVPLTPMQALGYQHVGHGIMLFENPGVFYKDPSGQLQSTKLVNYAPLNHHNTKGLSTEMVLSTKLLRDPRAFERVKARVIADFDANRARVPDDIYAQVAAAQPVNDTHLVARMTDRLFTPSKYRPTTYYLGGLPDELSPVGAHGLLMYQRRVHKLPPKLLDYHLDAPPASGSGGGGAGTDVFDSLDTMEAHTTTDPPPNPHTHTTTHTTRRGAPSFRLPHPLYPDYDPHHGAHHTQRRQNQVHVLGYMLYPAALAAEHEGALVAYR
jgi:hypothetical protein